MSCDVGRRPGLDPELLWLWCRPAATALIRPLAWEPPYGACVALKRQKDQKKKKKMQEPELIHNTSEERVTMGERAQKIGDRKGWQVIEQTRPQSLFRH